MDSSYLKRKERVPVAVVDGVAESGRVDDRQCQVDSVLFQKSLALFDLLLKYIYSSDAW